MLVAVGAGYAVDDIFVVLLVGGVLHLCEHCFGCFDVPCGQFYVWVVLFQLLFDLISQCWDVCYATVGVLQMLCGCSLVILDWINRGVDTASVSVVDKPVAESSGVIVDFQLVVHYFHLLLVGQVCREGVDPVD